MGVAIACADTCRIRERVGNNTTSESTPTTQ
jgi:hypothetical protein